ncbi:GTP-binding protein [Allomuricauda sp. d1]|uniref:GTP-binding protein n=1 Tax=Allomuricauda sp. d1 TaxID=3136725 RepID=UPI0031D727EA
MSELTNEIVLRPRFKIDVLSDLDTLKAVFDVKPKKPFTIKRIDEHVYLRFVKERTSFWSPQLHLELTSFEKGKSTIHGVFGPNPTLWTFFMFLHFGVATLFIILGIFAYSKYSLGHDITMMWIGMGFLVIIWFVLYAFGRLGKSKGKSQMAELNAYLYELVRHLPITK